MCSQPHRLCSPTGRPHQRQTAVATIRGGPGSDWCRCSPMQASIRERRASWYKKHGALYRHSLHTPYRSGVCCWCRRYPRCHFSGSRHPRGGSAGGRAGSKGNGTLPTPRQAEPQPPDVGQERRSTRLRLRYQQPALSQEHRRFVRVVARGGPETDQAQTVVGTSEVSVKSASLRLDLRLHALGAVHRHAHGTSPALACSIRVVMSSWLHSPASKTLTPQRASRHGQCSPQLRQSRPPGQS